MKDRATAYVSENYICKLPMTDQAVMARLLANKNWPLPKFNKRGKLILQPIPPLSS